MACRPWGALRRRALRVVGRAEGAALRAAQCLRRRRRDRYRAPRAARSHAASPVTLLRRLPVPRSGARGAPRLERRRAARARSLLKARVPDPTPRRHAARTPGAFMIAVPALPSTCCSLPSSLFPRSSGISPPPSGSQGRSGAKTVRYAGARRCGIERRSGLSPQVGGPRCSCWARGSPIPGSSGAMLPAQDGKAGRACYTSLGPS